MSDSATLYSLLPVPIQVARCTALPVYDYYSNNLKRIEIEWDPIPVCQTLPIFSHYNQLLSLQDAGEDITASITASVQEYIVSAVPIGISAPAINVTLEAFDHSVCSSTKCKHDFQSTSDMSALHYSVHVIAKNILPDGYSDGRICSNLTIGTKQI